MSLEAVGAGNMKFAIMFFTSKAPMTLTF